LSGLGVTGSSAEKFRERATDSPTELLTAEHLDSRQEKGPFDDLPDPEELLRKLRDDTLVAPSGGSSGGSSGGLFGNYLGGSLRQQLGSIGKDISDGLLSGVLGDGSGDIFDTDLRQVVDALPG
jgi:hypothetical protein